jgi:hypothetical protein
MSKTHRGGRGPAGCRQIIRDMLASTNYEITEAEDGGQALAAVLKERPDGCPTADHGRLPGHAPN